MNSRYNYNRRRAASNTPSSGAASALAFAIFGTLALGIWTLTLRADISSLRTNCEDLRLEIEEQRKMIDSLSAKPAEIAAPEPMAVQEKPRAKKSIPKDTSKAEKPAAIMPAAIADTTKQE